MSGTDLLRICRVLGLTPIPLKSCSKKPLVKWGNGWNPTSEELNTWASRPNLNWGVRCGPSLAAIDCKSEDDYRTFTLAHPLPPNCPVVKTSRGYHIWVKPKNPIRSQRVNGVEIKCIGSYVVAPPSVHPSGTPYAFVVAPNGDLPEVDLEELLELDRIETYPKSRDYESIEQSAPSDFALRYGK